MRLPHAPALALVALALGLAACDGGFGGEPAANRPPTTELSVRVTDLRETLGGVLLPSTVEVAWVGTDPDGYVAGYDFRYYDASRLGQIGAEEGWAFTTRRDTTIVLPIPEGASNAAVVFEVRAVDNAGARDPNPARTVFPIRNSPPSLQLLANEAPPDTTWPAFSFGWRAEDPDGAANLTAIEVALNDTSAGFVRLPATTEFVTFVAVDPGAAVSEVRVLLGRSGAPSELRIPGLRTDAPNVLYVRAVDAAGFRSPLVRYPDPDGPDTWFVRRVTSEILLVNDYRTQQNRVVMPYHRALLADYTGGPVDEWYLAEPFQTGSTVETRYSFNLPRATTPTLRETLLFWRYIYWVSNNATNRSLGNNLPLTANVLDPFISAGGRMFVNVPTRIPTSPDDNVGNEALALLPIAGLLSFGAGSPYPTFDPFLDLYQNARVQPVGTPPGGPALPALRAVRFIGGTFAYPVGGGILPLYEADYTGTQNGVPTPWTGPKTVASLRADGRVALFALPLVRDLDGAPNFVGADDGDPAAPRRAVQAILEALAFPR